MHWTTRGLRDRKLTDNALDFVRLLMSAPIHRIAIENPVSIISSHIRKPDQTIQPRWFGDNASKRTCLRLKNLPTLRPTNVVRGRMVTTPNGKVGERWENQCDSGQNKLAPSADRWKERSKTYQGIADAMAQQWSNGMATSGVLF